MEDWLNLINAETEGEIMDVEAATQIQEVKKAIVVLRQLNADEKVREEAAIREKRLHDEASALGQARREGKAEGLVEGTVSAFAGPVSDGILTVEEADKRSDMSINEFKQMAGLV